MSMTCTHRKRYGIEEGLRKAKALVYFFILMRLTLPELIAYTLRDTVFDVNVCNMNSIINDTIM